eukprot:GFYU01005624.1.p1 GENE.GFYU01005624.1~~GFYU01005624.1.p1  ORF type:complete len:729 (-),score=214.39 GFYU01005624.1:18-2204(-)
MTMSSFRRQIGDTLFGRNSRSGSLLSDGQGRNSSASVTFDGPPPDKEAIDAAEMRRKSSVVSRVQKEQPVQFLFFDASGTLHITDEAIDLLQSITDHVAVVSLVGMNKTGKSYLLNRILGYTHGFPIGSSTQPCTHGIWLWGTPVPHKLPSGEDIYVLFLDFEGFSSVDQTSEQDNLLFAMAVLLSSLLVYNSLGTIDDSALGYLNMVNNLTRYIHATPLQGDDEDDGTLYHSFFPTFMWVARDFPLSLVDDRGQEITAKEYLEDALRAQSGFSEKVAQKNRVRSILTTFFEERECATLIRPLATESECRDLDKIPFESTSLEFRRQVEILKNKLYSALTPKAINNVALEGSTFLAMTRTYVEAINANTVPTVSVAWDRILEAGNLAVLERSLEYYARHMTADVQNLFPMEVPDMRASHTKREDEAVLHYHEHSLGELTPASVKELKAKIDPIYKSLKARNMEESRKFCDNLFYELYSPLDVNLAEDKYTNFQEYEVDRSRVKESYFHAAVGPAKQQVWERMIDIKMAQCASHFQNALQSKTQRSHSKLEERVLIAERKVLEESLKAEREKSDLKSAISTKEAQISEMASRERLTRMSLQEESGKMAQYDSKMQEMSLKLAEESGKTQMLREQIATMRADHDAQVKDLKQRYEQSLKSDVERATTKYREDLELMQQDLKVAKGSIDVKNSQLESLKERLTSLQVELRVKEEEVNVLRREKTEKCCVVM